MTTLETLKAARAKIADRKNWTKGELCRPTAYRPWDKECTQWCSLGAIDSVLGRYGAGSEAEELMESLMPGEDPLLAQFNDSHTHKQVLALFDKAIALLEAA